MSCHNLQSAWYKEFVIKKTLSDAICCSKVLTKILTLDKVFYDITFYISFFYVNLHVGFGEQQKPAM